MRFLLLVLVLAAALPLSAQDFEAEPLYGTARLATGFTPDPHAVEVVAGGTTPNPIDGPGCVGYIEAGQPDVNVEYTAGAILDLSLYVESSGDTALLVRTPSGDWVCSDDVEGLNPRVDVPTPRSGTYSVWVASFGEGVSDATLYVTERLAKEAASTAPDHRATPLYGDVVLQAGFTPDPNEVGVLAGGTDPNPVDGPGCVGYIAARQPDVNVTYSASAEWDLAMYARSDVDTALLIRAPDGQWICSDDVDGVDPRIDFPMPKSGTYHVWVASVGAGGGDAMLHITEVLRSAPAPDHRAVPRFGRVTLEAGFEPDPYEVEVEAGGATENPITGFGCVGYITPAQPDVVIDYTAGSSDLSFRVESDTDTALLIRSPDGRWLCDDDTDGLDPLVTVTETASGAYTVWVASFGGDVEAATLVVTEPAR